MSKEKIRNSIWFVIFDGLKIYFSNIDKFILYMLFPVFGQIAGLALAFGLTVGFADKVAQKAHSMNSAMAIILLLAIPGLLIFMKAFWDYMVAYVALNSMTEGAITTGHVYDIQAHRQVATRRAFKYIGFLFVVGFLSLFGVLTTTILIGLVPSLIFWVFFMLVYQVFTFEDELSIKECFKRSFNLVKGDWARTFFLMIILWFFSIYIITEGVSVIFDCLHLTDKICALFDFAGNNMPLEYFNKALRYINLPELTVNMVSKTIFMAVLTTIVAALSLPIRSICCTLWYKTMTSLKDGKTEQKPKKQKKSKKEKEEE
jgi:hypothetical protein